MVPDKFPGTICLADGSPYVWALKWRDGNGWLYSRVSKLLRYRMSTHMKSPPLSLGDRHGENILLDFSSGEAMHVDFSCLFDKVISPKSFLVYPYH